MKKIFYAAVSLSFALAACSPKIIYTNNPPPDYQQPQQNNPPQQQAYADQSLSDQPQTDQVFYDQLSPYGQWIDYPGYGYVWQPNVDPDFRPYATNGYWVYSDYGWTWNSNYAWGWAPFHYGNWFYDNSYGWLWQPGTEWAPAWVTWGQSGNYYGWAPVPPGADANAGWRPRNEDWNYVPAGNITDANVNRYVVRNNVTVINKTTIINNVTNNNTTNNYTTNNHTTIKYNRGPLVTDVENITNTKIQQVKISGSAKPGQSLTNNQLNMYRPMIKQSAPQGTAKPAPQKVVSYNSNNTNPARQNANQLKKPVNEQNPSSHPAYSPGNNPNQQAQKASNPQNNNPQQPGMGQNPNRQNISRPITVQPNTNPPKPQYPAPVNPQSNNQGNKPVNPQGNNQNQPNNVNGKKADTSKRHVKKIIPSPPVKQQN
jgi:hypothetical protein